MRMQTEKLREVTLNDQLGVVERAENIVRINWQSGLVSEIPFILNYTNLFMTGSSYIFEKPVTQTKSTSFHERAPRYAADMSNNNFGVGDIVLFNPKTIQPRSRKSSI